jgi:hypothetical protein
MGYNIEKNLTRIFKGTEENMPLMGLADWGLL